MATAGQVFEAKLRKDLANLITGNKLKRSAELMGEEAVKIIKQRTNEGIDIYGRKFGNYNQGYLAQKKRRYGSNRGWLQASGDLFEDITYEVLKITQNRNGASIKIKVTVKERSYLKTIGLQDTTGTARNGKKYSKKAWLFLGLSQTGARVMSEQKRLVDIFNKTVLGKKVPKSLQIKV